MADVEPDDPAPQKRFYARPRPGESREEFAHRFKAGVLGLIAEQDEDHPADVTELSLREDDSARTFERLNRVQSREHDETLN